MKKFVLLSVMALALPTALLAQDDVYFTPSKESVREYKDAQKTHRYAYYSGISKSDSEYNRRNALDKVYRKIGQDSLGNDIVQYKSQDGIYRTDTIYQFDRYFESTEDDFAYSRRLGRFDDFYGYYSPWYYDYPHYGFRYSYRSWDPWYWGYYDPWYMGYYDPWYYRYRRGWYDPWGDGYYGWGYPYYYYGYARPYIRYNYAGGHSGTANHWGGAYGGSFGSRGSVYNGQPRNVDSPRSFGNMNARSGQFGNSRNRVVIERNNSSNNRGNSFGTLSRDRKSEISPRREVFDNRNSFGNQRETPRNYNPSPSRGPSHSVGGGSFGGSRSGGGSHTGGGGFGGRR